MASPAAARPKPSGGSDCVKAYLVAYNVAQMLGWLVLLVVVVSHLVREGSVRNLFQESALLLYIFQTAAILEVLHCALGLVRSSVVLTAFQVASRVFLTWGVAYGVPTCQNSAGVAMFLLAWSVTEVIRYSFYFTSLLGQVPYFLVWCRYTFFIFLYPIGVTGELLTIWNAMPQVQASRQWSLELPNSLNVAFSYHVLLWLVTLSYLPVFPQLYSHMLNQRRKIIGGGGGARPKTE